MTGAGMAEMAGMARRADSEVCCACGSRDLATDTVEQQGWLWLAECRHCDHRWTWRSEVAPAAPLRVHGAVTTPERVANAA